MAPHIALHEIGAPFQGRPISFAKKEQLQPAFLALNPEGKVPTLLIDGRPLTEDEDKAERQRLNDMIASPSFISLEPRP